MKASPAKRPSLGAAIARSAAHRAGTRAAYGPLAHSVRAPITRGAVLIGDAAGFLNPFHRSRRVSCADVGRTCRARDYRERREPRGETGAFATYAAIAAPILPRANA